MMRVTMRMDFYTYQSDKKDSQSTNRPLPQRELISSQKLFTVAAIFGEHFAEYVETFLPSATAIKPYLR